MTKKVTKKELVDFLNKYPDDAIIETWEAYSWGDYYPLDKEMFKYIEKENKVIL